MHRRDRSEIAKCAKLSMQKNQKPSGMFREREVKKSTQSNISIKAYAMLASDNEGVV